MEFAQERSLSEFVRTIELDQLRRALRTLTEFAGHTA